MRSITAFVAFVLVMAVAVLPALSNPLFPVGPNGRPFRVGIPVKPFPDTPIRLSTAARRELRNAKRILDTHCSGLTATLPADCFLPKPHPHSPFFGNVGLELRNAKRIINLHCSGDPATIPADCFNNPPKPIGGFLGGFPFSIKPAIGKRVTDLRCSGLAGAIPADCFNRAPPKPLFPGGPIPLELRALAEALAA
ncbi:hypothetical protein BDY19DRAFT_904986 [Irpex rosettiformis]|uniref:Uncharacterized protein n=1 Tax=Irpex rosettiformis TaxID=378272 RepID=A0ACB8U8L1_9APHY|nr:hypothetical protein BDY19DRAFT_904986 [Irpex rosettiformis]